MSLLKFIFGIVLAICVEVVLIPFQIIAFMVAAYFMIAVSAKLNTSMTAVKILEGRILMDWFGLRKDQLSVELGRRLPNFSIQSLYVVLLPLIIYRRVSGRSPFTLPVVGDETFKDLVHSRTVVYDEMLQTWSLSIRERGLKPQFVHLGAGFDTRSLQPQRFGFTGGCFEVDQVSVQQIKLKAIEKSVTLRECKSSVHFVVANFEEAGDWVQNLINTGLDIRQPMLFLWEGVTLYLDESSVQTTLDDIKRLCQQAPDKTCRLITGLYSSQVIDFTYDKSLKKARKTLDYTGESWKFGLPFESNEKWRGVIEKFVSKSGYTLGTHVGLGANNIKGPFLVCTEMIVSSDSR